MPGSGRTPDRTLAAQLHRYHSNLARLLDPDQLLGELEKLCASCKGEGLDDEAIRTILSGARLIVTRSKKLLPTSAVLNDFTPLNVIVTEEGIGISDYAHMMSKGNSFQDVAQFMASVGSAQKYPFCNRNTPSSAGSCCKRMA